MKVLQITGSDLAGGRFNGLLLRHHFQRIGVDTRYMVWRKASTDDAVVRKALNYPGSRVLTYGLTRLEQLLSIQNALNLQWLGLPLYRAFRDADLLHYHLLHDGGYFSLLSLPWYARWKPAVWTLHDPWAMTGHCVHPMDCTGWLLGCPTCPHLDWIFPLAKDRAHLNFLLKQWSYQRSRLHLVVASPWMMRMVQRSPLMQGLTVHHVPFGLDLQRFRPLPMGPARRRLGIPDDHVVICMRAMESPFKGMEYVRAALRNLHVKRKVCLLTFQGEGGFDEFIGRYRIVELGWTDDEALLIDAYTAADFFLMPSVAEAFGMMAIEAMACGKPVICFEGTALPETTFAPEVGLAIPREAQALAAALARWIDNPHEVAARGVRAREIAEQHYGVDRFAAAIKRVYEAALQDGARRRPSA